MPTTAELQRSAHDMIVAWADGPSKGKLVRNGSSRNATMAIMEYTPTERNSIQFDGATKLRVSKIGLTIEPDPQLDIIQFGGKTYKINAPIRGPKPQGTFLYCDCDCLEVAP